MTKLGAVGVVCSDLTSAEDPYGRTSGTHGPRNMPVLQSLQRAPAVLALKNRVKLWVCETACVTAHIFQSRLLREAKCMCRLLCGRICANVCLSSHQCHFEVYLEYQTIVLAILQAPVGEGSANNLRVEGPGSPVWVSIIFTQGIFDPRVEGVLLFTIWILSEVQVFRYLHLSIWIPQLLGL